MRPTSPGPPPHQPARLLVADRVPAPRHTGWARPACPTGRVPGALILGALILAVLLLAGLGPAGIAWAAAPMPSDFRAILPQLQPAIRAELQRRAAQSAGWSPGQRARFAAQTAAWDALPAGTRSARRAQYLAWQALPLRERALVRASAARYAGLPLDQQQALRERFAQLDGSDQRGWVLGPVLGADYAALQPLLAQVPIDQHGRLLQVLRELAPAQRADLAVLVQRTPPQERAALRRELLSTAPSNRQQWLWQRLDR